MDIHLPNGIVGVAHFELASIYKCNIGLLQFTRYICALMALRFNPRVEMDIGPLLGIKQP